ncbi:receptor-like protein kinase At3g21340 [Rhodamnia argentea]|uniref:Receptor-like protein kinase At3g21340 n=1 Tax=Rhodamnia argentea TaxID=178133 RepID=A0A8B8QHX1_9MYRT|nr:receptor-like protein kinase At3g21340 [Rhodamnia argentea]
MEIGMLFFLVFFALKVLSQDTLSPLRIDCGSETSYDAVDGILWHTDSDFVKRGQNVQLPNGNLSAERQISTLRFFPEQNKDCYSLPAAVQKRYFIRAVFFYGNYDGLSRPSSFGLEFDGDKWTTVSNSTAEPQYYEPVNTSWGDLISVCMARTQDEQYPFILALELWPLPDGMYATMGQDRA